MMKTLPFYIELDNFYSKEALFKLFKTYFLNWISEGYIGKNLNVFEISLIKEDSSKEIFLNLLEEALQPDTFKVIYKTLPKRVQEIFYTIAWNGKYFIEDNREEILTNGTNYDLNKNLHNEFLFFKIIKDIPKKEYLSLNYSIIKNIRKGLEEKPKEYHILNSEELNYEFNDHNEKEFIENIKIYYNFFKQSGISLSSSGKILKNIKINMMKYCNITEYYQDGKDLEQLKTENIALFFYLINEDTLIEKFSEDDGIKNLVLEFLSGKALDKNSLSYSFLYLNFLKGNAGKLEQKENLIKCFNTITKVIKEFSSTNTSNSTVSIDNIINRILFQDDFIDIIAPDIAYEYLYINEANYERTKILNYEKYIEYVIIPFIKSIFFLLGSLGIFEVFYNKPKNDNSLFIKSGHLSKFDGLKYVKLTEFGKYVFDIQKKYQFKELKTEGTLELDEERLIITILGDSPSKTILCEKIGIKISPHKYKVTTETLLNDIFSKTDLIKKINNFKSSVKCDLPTFWEEFFNTALQNSLAIEVTTKYVVLALKNNKELLQLISTNKKLKDLVLRCEDYHLLVKKENFEIAIATFKELGYIIENFSLDE